MDPMMSLQLVAIRGMSVGARMLCCSDLCPCKVCLLIRISTTLSAMSDSLFTTPTHRNACFIRWWIKSS
jgi:hypothetical protein